MALKLISSLDMNDIKQEDVMLYDEGGQGNVSGAAVVADGATGFLKDVDVRGNLVSLPDIVSGGYSSARVWAEKLAERLLANMADERLGLRQLLPFGRGAAGGRPSVRGTVVCCLNIGTGGWKPLSAVRCWKR
jgi:hypothetical protein